MPNATKVSKDHSFLFFFSLTNQIRTLCSNPLIQRTYCTKQKNNFKPSSLVVGIEIWKKEKFLVQLPTTTFIINSELFSPPKISCICPTTGLQRSYYKSAMAESSNWSWTATHSLNGKPSMSSKLINTINTQDAANSNPREPRPRQPACEHSRRTLGNARDPMRDKVSSILHHPPTKCSHVYKPQDIDFAAGGCVFTLHRKPELDLTKQWLLQDNSPVDTSQFILALS